MRHRLARAAAIERGGAGAGEGDGVARRSDEGRGLKRHAAPVHNRLECSDSAAAEPRNAGPQPARAAAKDEQRGREDCGLRAANRRESRGEQRRQEGFVEERCF